ncbi:MAG: TRAP transporter substrate-binding protein [Tenacibaculum sp.]
MKKDIKFFIYLIASIAVIGCTANHKKKTLKLAHGLDINHSVHKAMLKMGEDLLKISDGQMNLEIYPSQQLGTERQCLELLQIGSLDMTKVSSGVMENFAPKMKVFGVPFLFKSRKHVYKVLDGKIGKQLLKESEAYRLKSLGYYDAGSRSFYTKDTPVDMPEDLNGLKIRVMESVTAMNMVRSLGGSPTPISWGELYTALQQGVVDGAENNLPSFYLSGHYEVCKFFILDEHTVLPDVLLIGIHTWKKLTKQQQIWLQQAVDKSISYQRELWIKDEEKALNEVQKAGVKVIRPDKSLFFKKVENIYKQYKAENKDLYTLVQQIKEAQ